MLVRDGPYWRVQAQPDSDFFTVFITPHWNEVLNPNRYARYFSARLRTLISQRCPDALDHYRDEHGRLRSAAQFDAIARDLKHVLRRALWLRDQLVASQHPHCMFRYRRRTGS